MILYSDLRKLMATALDAENSDRYKDFEDYIPAVNYAIKMAVTAFNTLFAEKKISENVLKELTYVKVFQASLHSRVAFDSTIVKFDLWDVLMVWVKPTVKQKVVSPLPAATDESVYLPNESFLDSDFPCDRITLQEWSEGNHNNFKPGSSFIICDELIQYGWLNFANYTGGYSLTNSPFEIGIKPFIPGERVAIALLKNPTEVVNITDSVEFPKPIELWLVNQALKFISYKQNNKTSVYEVTAVELQSLTKMMS